MCKVVVSATEHNNSINSINNTDGKTSPLETTYVVVNWGLAQQAVGKGEFWLQPLSAADIAAKTADDAATELAQLVALTSSDSAVSTPTIYYTLDRWTAFGTTTTAAAAATTTPHPSAGTHRRKARRATCSVASHSQLVPTTGASLGK